MDALDRPGVWKRAGLSAVITGLDMSEAMACVPPECDRDLCQRLFVVAEESFVAEHLTILKSETSTNA